MRFIQFLFASLATIFAATTAVHADEWRGTITPYVWLPSFSSSFTVGDNPPSYGDVSIWDKLEGAFMISGDYRNDEYAILGDYIYLNLGDQLFTDLPPLATDTGLKGYTFMMSAAKTLSRNEDSHVEAYLGFRHWNAEATAANEALGTFRVNTSWTDPIIGLQGHYDVNDRVSLKGSADVGGFGIGSELQMDAKGQVNWAFNDTAELGLGYRYLSVDFDDRGKLLLDMTIQGPYMALDFNF